MKIEYLASGSPDCPLVRIHSFGTSEISALRAICRKLHEGSLDEYSLGSLPDLESIGGCQITLKAESRDRGLVLIAPPASFEWILSRETWDNIEGLLEPFEQSDAAGHQWLNASGGFSALISRDGMW